MYRPPLTIIEKLRAQHISRWNIVATTRTQSVAEHSYNVALIVADICERLPVGRQPNKSLLVAAALEHDQWEIITGDIPTPAKEEMRQMHFDPDVLEGPMSHVEALSKEEKNILKIADMMEAMWFLDNFGAGRRAKRVGEDIEKKMSVKVQDCIDSSIFQLVHALTFTDILDEMRDGEMTYE